MGCEERQCDYCGNVGTNYWINSCDVCDRYVCDNEESPDCNFMKVPESKEIDDVWTCGYCQLKKKLNGNKLEEFKQKEKLLRKQIQELEKNLKNHYKQLESIDKI